MSIQNLEQVRARHALDFAKNEAPKCGANGGEAIKKIPPMILQSGLMASIAFATEQKKGKNEPARSGFAAAFDAISRHLCDERVAILKDVKSGADLIDALADADSEVLKLATAETLEWLGYARRFVSLGDGGDEG